MKPIIMAFAIATLGAVGLGARSAETQRKPEIDVRKGKDVTVTGCLEQNPGGGYMLTDVANGTELRYVLISDGDLSKDVGRRVEVKGQSVGQVKGKLKSDSSVKTTGDKGATATTGGLGRLPFLGVKSIGVIADACR